MLKLCKIGACPNGTLGLHLSRAPWDPYPWVSGVQEGSSAYQAGVRTGDTVLELNGSDILGQKISELATKIRSHWESGGNYVSFLIWRSKNDQSAINQQSLQKFATCLQNIAQLLECPICLEVVKPPGWQCCNGHVLCNSCRGRTVKCPICRVTLGPRGRCLLSDKLFTLLAETFPCDDKKQDDTGRCSDRRASAPAKITSPKSQADEKQIISIKVDFKSPQQATQPVQHKNYQCPTGKSCAGQGDDETSKMLNQWDVLTHLRRAHHLSVVQYYGTYGEQIQVEFMNKSIPCISIASVRLPPNASLTPQNVSAIPLNPTQVMPGGLFKPSTGLEKMQGVELFFVARVPIGNGSAVPAGSERCAIFIWYCGNECNVKKFRAVIECKRSATKWTGCIHPLTMSWDSVQRRREYLQLKFDVSDFLHIVIKIK